MPTLENWEIVRISLAYTPPEVCPARLNGNIYGDPRFKDGEGVTTSKLKKLNIPARTAETNSGTKYKLGEPSKPFLAWLKSEGISLDDYKVVV